MAQWGIFFFLTGFLIGTGGQRKSFRFYPIKTIINNKSQDRWIQSVVSAALNNLSTLDYGVSALKLWKTVPHFLYKHLYFQLINFQPGTHTHS